MKEYLMFCSSLGVISNYSAKHHNSYILPHKQRVAGGIQLRTMNLYLYTSYTYRLGLTSINMNSI